MGGLRAESWLIGCRGVGDAGLTGLLHWARAGGRPCLSQLKPNQPRSQVSGLPCIRAGQDSRGASKASHLICGETEGREPDVTVSGWNSVTEAVVPVSRLKVAPEKGAFTGPRGRKGALGVSGATASVGPPASLHPLALLWEVPPACPPPPPAPPSQASAQLWSLESLQQMKEVGNFLFPTVATNVPGSCLLALTGPRPCGQMPALLKKTQSLSGQAQSHPGTGGEGPRVGETYKCLGQLLCMQGRQRPWKL